MIVPIPVLVRPPHSNCGDDRQRMQDFLAEKALIDWKRNYRYSLAL